MLFSYAVYTLFNKYKFVLIEKNYIKSLVVIFFFLVKPITIKHNLGLQQCGVLHKYPCLGETHERDIFSSRSFAC